MLFKQLHSSFWAVFMRGTPPEVGAGSKKCGAVIVRAASMTASMVPFVALVLRGAATSLECLSGNAKLFGGDRHWEPAFAFRLSGVCGLGVFGTNICLVICVHFFFLFGGYR